MRYGEIAVVTPKNYEPEGLVRAVCPEVVRAGDTLSFGRLPITDNLTLQVYGMQIESPPERYRWELLLPRALGVVVAYRWHERASLEQAQRLVDYLCSSWQTPVLVAADTGDAPPPVPSTFYAGGIRLSSNAKFLFFQSPDPASVRQLFTTLLDVVAERTTDYSI
ncbi:MAG: hypothetical protein ONB30_04090 [candidate division KSB1 bacterium]|nr:hypothetical protein [candidate division KSB1 bacterium]